MEKNNNRNKRNKGRKRRNRRRNKRTNRQATGFTFNQLLTDSDKERMEKIKENAKLSRRK